MTMRAIDVSAVIEDHQIVTGATIEVGDGEFVGVVGPNGSGKSTLLRCLYRVLRPAAGRVELDGDDVWRLSQRAAARRMAVVVQEPPSEFDMTVRELVMMGRSPHLRLLDRVSESDEQIVDDALYRVEVAQFGERMFGSLSGGEKQRVLLARSLAQQPRLLVLDEPTNHLDIRHQIEVLELVRQLGIATVAALHDLNLASSYCDRLYVLSDGAIVSSGSPTEVLTPELVSKVFGVGAARSEHPITGAPQLVFFPIGRHRQEEVDVS